MAEALTRARSIPIIAALLTLVPVLCLADPGPPDTPAGRVFGDFLDAFNSVDRERAAAFLEAHPSSGMTLDEMAQWSEGSGGYELLDVISSEPANVFFRLKQRKNGVEEFGRLEIRTAKPAEIAAFEVWRIPAGAVIEAGMLDESTRARVVNFTARTYDSAYVDPQVGRQMAATLKKRAARGDYRAMRYGDAFAARLTQDLREVSHDKHVEVRFSYFVEPAHSSVQTAAADAKDMAAINCGFEKAEHLPPNIGYLKFDMFADPAICAGTAGAALTFLADSDALVIDLRDNHGGAPGMVELIATYLLSERTHLDDIYNRVDNATIEEWTLPYVPGRKFIGKPVFVLTSKTTFSAAEALSYWLKNLKRATLVGETTAGGAHPTEVRRIDDHFSIRVPHARSVNPITGSNWEGTGVEPDVKVAADQALEVALKLASEAVGRK